VTDILNVFQQITRIEADVAGLVNSVRSISARQINNRIEVNVRLDGINELLKQIFARLPLPSAATRIAVELPMIRKKDGTMANFEINDDWVVTATIKTTNSAGDTEPVPPGDVFSVSSSSPSLGVAIGTDASGNPAVVMTPMVQASPAITVTVGDSAGLTAFSFVVDIVPDVTPTNIVVDLADATHITQPTPTAPGP
jgi:hypothetical protein